MTNIKEFIPMLIWLDFLYQPYSDVENVILNNLMFANNEHLFHHASRSDLLLIKND